MKSTVLLCAFITMVTAALFHSDPSVTAHRRAKVGKLFDTTFKLLGAGPGDATSPPPNNHSQHIKPSEQIRIFDKSKLNANIQKALGKKLLNFGSIMAGTVGLFFGPVGPIVSAMIAPFIADLMYDMKKNRKKEKTSK